jgi:hypothetical protein
MFSISIISLTRTNFKNGWHRTCWIPFVCVCHFKQHKICIFLYFLSNSFWPSLVQRAIRDIVITLHPYSSVTFLQFHFLLWIHYTIWKGTFCGVFRIWYSTKLYVYHIFKLLVTIEYRNFKLDWDIKTVHEC